MAYLVTIRIDGRLVARRDAIGNSFDLHAAAIDEFGPCSVTIVRRV